MISLILASAIAASAAPPQDALTEAEHAIEAGRLDQARIMIGNAMKAGAGGEIVERLIAELAFTSGDFYVALGGYETLHQARPENALYAERAGISAFRTGKLERATALLDLATSKPDVSWRAWNARGVVADHLGDWEVAKIAYASAAALSPDNPAILNNMGWSLLLQDAWEEGLALLERAAMLDPKSDMIAHNLELARAATSSDLPRRRRGENDEEWAARLNDAGVVASLRGDRGKAIAAFTRAIEAQSRWFDRAANNLALAKDKR